MRCEEFEDRLNAMIDEGRGGAWDGDIWQHWERCSYCRQVADSYTALLDGVRNMQRPPMPPELTSRILNELRPSTMPVHRWSMAAALLATAAGVLVAITGFFQKPSIPNTVALASQEDVGRENAAPRPLGWAEIESLRNIEPLIAMVSSDDPYQDLARGTAHGLTTVFWLTPGLSVDTISSLSDPVLPGPVSEGLKPLAQPVNETMNLLRRAMPLAAKS